jgi:hypothetical protein
VDTPCHPGLVIEEKLKLTLYTNAVTDGFLSAATGCLGDFPDTKNTVSLEQRYTIGCMI